MIMLRALGKAEIDTGMATLTPSQEIAFAVALYLILERGKRVSRRYLASLLWPLVAEKTRGHRLRQTVLQLKKAGFIVTADRNSLECSAKNPSSDIAELAEAGPDALASRASLEFLPGYSPVFSEPFRDWIDGQREETHALVTSRLVTELNTARAKGDWATCDRFARQCRKLDPFNEAAVLAQAEASAMRGAKTQAVEILDRFIADVGSDNPNLRVSATVLRKRITDRIPERSPITVRECAFVGRDQEMETMTSALVAARRGNGGARLLRGEAGIGKSRLASELMKFAALEGTQTSRTSCRRADVDRPLSIFVDLVPQLSELRGALGCSQESMAVLKGLTEFDGRASFSALSVDDSMSAHARTRAALFDLFDAIAEERTVLIVIDDVQWVDASSVRLLAELFPWAKSRKVLFVLTERFGPHSLTSHFAPDDLKTLTLGPLGSQAGEAIVAEVLKDSSRPTTAELFHRLLSVGEGNPFFLQALGNHWLETGRDRGSPPSVTAIIDERLARLSSEALLVLQACAVLNVNATFERVEGVLEYQSHVLLSAIQELSLAGMLRAESPISSESAELLTVGHDLISTAALERLTNVSMSFLHRRAGTVLERETQTDGARTAILWACAFHWQNAGDRERAFRTACSCGEHLLAVGLSRDAASAFERALDYCITDDQLLLVLSRVVISLQMCGLWEESKGVLHKTRVLQAKTAPNANSHDDVELALFEARWRVSLQHTSLVQELRACVATSEASPSHRVMCALLGLKVASDTNDIDAIEEVYRTVVPLLRNPAIAPIVSLEIEMIYHSVCGDLRMAEQAADKLRREIRNERDPRTISRALYNVGIGYRFAGRMADMEELFRELCDHSLMHGISTRFSFGMLALIRLYLTKGDLARARATLTELDTRVESDQDFISSNVRLLYAARLAFEEGNIEKAAEQYALAAEVIVPGITVNWRAAVLALGVRIAIEQRRSVEIVRPIVAELKAAHLQNRRSGGEDFEAHSLALGVSYCGEPEEAFRLLADYAEKHRRETWALPQTIRDLLQELRASEALASTHDLAELALPMVNRV
jgi:DNA-binding SARP family transcriptional activator/tetratricopeptide (TPR) repeat protein